MFFNKEFKITYITNVKELTHIKNIVSHIQYILKDVFKIAILKDNLHDLKFTNNSEIKVVSDGSYNFQLGDDIDLIIFDDAEAKNLPKFISFLDKIPLYPLKPKVIINFYMENSTEFLNIVKKDYLMETNFQILD